MAKLSISNIAWTKEEDARMYQVLKEAGFTGIEIAPTRIFTDSPYEKLEEIKSYADRLSTEYGVAVSSMQSIWYGKDQKLFGSEKERQELFAYTKKAILFAEAAKCKNLVFGSPRNRVINVEEDYKTAVDFFRELGEFAREHHTVLAMEANPTIYNTNFITTTEEAFKLVEEVDSEGFLVNLDLGTIIQNGEEITAIKGHMDKVNHIHISEPGLVSIKKRKIHQELRALVEDSSYDGFVSIEMKSGLEVSEIKEMIRYVSEVFRES